MVERFADLDTHNIFTCIRQNWSIANVGLDLGLQYCPLEAGRGEQTFTRK